jgi:DNA-binding MarR family transcriptional regulator
MMKESITKSTGYSIAQICGMHLNRASKLLSTADIFVGPEMFLLQLWHQDSLTLSQMANSMCVQPATITRMVERMKRNGLVERRNDIEDGRVSRIFLTQTGRVLHEPVHQLWSELESISRADFTPE